MLQSDGRCPNTRIAEAVGLSESAVRQRIGRLLDDGVMQIVAVTDPMQLGLRRMAMLGIRADGPIDEVAARCEAIPEADYVVSTAGSFDLLVEVVVEDDDDLFRLMNESVRTIPGVRSAEIFMYLKLHKQTYAWGTV
jgi:Lrp/AsnC family transcriptional regulator for asnA, asnC and gidA